MFIIEVLQKVNEAHLFLIAVMVPVPEDVYYDF